VFNKSDGGHASCLTAPGPVATGP